MSTSIRLSATIKKRVSKLAATHDMTPHGFMVQAIEEKVAAEERHEEFVADAEHRLLRMKKTGVGIPADEVFDYFKQRASGRSAKRPRARPLR